MVTTNSERLRLRLSVFMQAVAITAVTTGLLAVLLSWQGSNLARDTARKGLQDLAREMTEALAIGTGNLEAERPEATFFGRFNNRREFVRHDQIIPEAAAGAASPRVYFAAQASIRRSPSSIRSSGVVTLRRM